MCAFKKSIQVLTFIMCAFLLTSCGSVYLRLVNEYPKIEIKEDYAIINGVLGKTFHKQFQQFVTENPSIKNVVLENIPGSMNDEWNVKTCRLIRSSGINTILTKHSLIASGGVDLFIAGNIRSIEDGAKIGVHSWRDVRKDGSHYPKDAEEHQLFIDYFNYIGMDTSFYWFTLEAAPANSIHWMTTEEIIRFNLKTN